MAPPRTHPLLAFAALAAVLVACGSSASAQRSESTGARAEALRPCEEHWDHGRRVEARACYQALLRNADLGVQAEAFWGLGDLKRANDSFRAAVRALPQDPDLRVRWGYLFLQSHNPGEASQLFQEALAIEESYGPAKMGLVAVQGGRFDGKALEAVSSLVDDHPEMVNAYVYWARMLLEEQDYEAAEDKLQTALEKAEETNQSPLEAYALLAALDLMQDKPTSEWTAKALEYNPLFGRVYSEPAHFYVITRRYREATELYTQAVETDPELWPAHADLAVNLLRQGKETEARHHLEISYEGDPFSAKTVNTLRLLDSFKDFRTYNNTQEALKRAADDPSALVDTPRVILKLHQDEAAPLKPYVMELAERSITTMQEKYGFRLKDRVLIELYPEHDDFSVRTVGLAGVGLLGVTFGHVIAMDSPAARTPGEFHWGSTLWHEMAHVFTLEMTGHLIPRWFSEGVSMYEEWQAHTTWGEQVSPDFLEAIEDEKLLPVADLDKGFIRPRYPNQIGISYYQAGLVCQLIADRWGFEKIRHMLDSFAKGKSTEAAIEAALGIPPEEFDEEFDKYLKERFGPRVESLDDWQKAYKAALLARKSKNWDGVIESATEARELYPEFVDGSNPYTLLADAYEGMGDTEAAAEQLLAYQRAGGRHPDRLKKLAEMLAEQDRLPEAIEVLQQLVYIWPNDDALHSPLAGWLFEEARYGEALQHYQTILDLRPHDVAGAHYNLARTYHKMQDRTRSRRHVLMALDAAPAYRPAQKLLLELRE